jgi:hypothetical protein
MLRCWSRRTAFLVVLVLLVPLPVAAGVVTGELKKWHTVTIDFQGPFRRELESSPNPFLDYRLQVTLTAPSGRVYSVPGFFDGNGTGFGEGTVWRVRFAPDEAGEWSYQASFRTGADVAVSLDPVAGTPTSFNGDTGSFSVQGADPSAPGFLRHGRLESVGNFYFKFREGGYWVKAGMNNPENFLGYRGFDNTPFGTHSYTAHVAHWKPGDPNWDSPDNPGVDDGKGIIGAVNYLSEQSLNSIYFMPMNIGADAMDTWPYAGTINRFGSSANDNRHFDISKLRQWGIVLDHAQRKGLLLHFVLSDKTIANKNELDNATLGVERKLFYREMIARFGHHNALQWNICEEYNLDLPLDPNLIKAFAQYIRDVDPYNHPVTVHPHGNTYKEALQPFMGDTRFGVLSVQTWQLPDDVGKAIEYFRQTTSAAGWPIPTNVDEHIGMNQITAADYRKRIIWDALFSGGGFELFKSFSDQDLDDFTVYEEYMRYARIARTFVETELPFWEMSPADSLVTGENTVHGGAEVFVKPGQVYAVYLPNASPTPSLSMGTATGTFERRWFNPRTGLFEGLAQTFTATPSIALGPPPSSPLEDWVILIRAVSGGANAPPVSQDQTAGTSADTAVAISLSYTDPDGPGPYTFTVATSPQHGVVSQTGGIATYTPAAGFTGSDSFQWRVSDGLASSELATVTILVSDSVVIFIDDFGRTAGSAVGNGWIERETTGGAVEIAGGALQFTDTSDLTNRPLVYRPFARVTSGQLEWEFLFNWTRTAPEGTYRLFMQLGDGSLMNDNSWDAGVGVNLIWTVIGGVHEMLGYRRNGTTVGLGVLRGSARIRVNVDLDAGTYAVSVNDIVVGQGILLDQATAGLDTVRFFTDALNETNFAGRTFDDVQLHHAGNGENRPPAASSRTVTTAVNTTTTIQLEATDPENDPLEYIIVAAPQSGALNSNDGDSAIIYVPNQNFTGTDAFSFKVSDGVADSNVATVTVVVQSGSAVAVFSDSFDRAASATVGNGWVERETTSATVGVNGTALVFSQASDQINRPMVSHAFTRTSGGTLEWEFDFDWTRIGPERTYRLLMQLGDSSLMNDDSPNAGIGVNLIWTAINGANESLGYVLNGTPVALAAISGPTRIKVTVDFTARTYGVSVDGQEVGPAIALDPAVSALDTIRFFVDALATAHFATRTFDAVVIRVTP